LRHTLPILHYIPPIPFLWGEPTAIYKELSEGELPAGQLTAIRKELLINSKYESKYSVSKKYSRYSYYS
jgi:hypothetical protein